MPHLQTRIVYEPYAHLDPTATKQLTDDERVAHAARERLSHASSLFFLISQMDIPRSNIELFPDLNMHLRNLGELGNLICDGAFGDLDQLAEMVDMATTFAEPEVIS